jgi:hypothetical protein
MLLDGTPDSIMRALEAQVLGVELTPLTAEEFAIFARTDWRSWCDAWQLASMEHLISEEMAYPASFRVLPTRLGNMIRATGDQLYNTEADLQSLALNQHVENLRGTQIQYARSRNRLEMYSILVFVSALLAVLTPVVLLGRGIDTAAIAIILGIFAILSAASYHAAIISATRYCSVLKQIDEASAQRTDAVRPQ